MKLTTAVLIAVLPIFSAAGEEGSSVAVVPQPRVRLDPAARTPAAVPPSEVNKTPSGGAVVLEALVVKSHGEIPAEPQKPAEPTGEFSVLKGGRVLTGDAAGSRVQVGLWPTVDLFAKDAGYKAPKTRADLDIVRIQW